MADPVQQQVVDAVQSGRMTPTEAAQQFGKPAGTVRSWLFRARAMLGAQGRNVATAAATQRGNGDAPTEPAPRVVPASIPEAPAQYTGRGRPSKFTRDRVQRILDALAQGNHRRHAATAGGVCESVFMEWMARGREAAPGDEAYADFAESVEEAEAAFAATQMRHVTKAAPKDWKAAAFLLERRFPADFGKAVAVKHSGEVATPPNPVEAYTPTQLAAAAAALASTPSAPPDPTMGGLVDLPAVDTDLELEDEAEGDDEVDP